MIIKLPNGDGVLASTITAVTAVRDKSPTVVVQTASGHYSSIAATFEQAQQWRDEIVAEWDRALRPIVPAAAEAGPTLTTLRLHVTADGVTTSEPDASPTDKARLAATMAVLRDDLAKLMTEGVLTRPNVVRVLARHDETMRGLGWVKIDVAAGAQPERNLFPEAMTVTQAGEAEAK